MKTAKLRLYSVNVAGCYSLPFSAPDDEVAVAMFKKSLVDEVKADEELLGMCSLYLIGAFSLTGEKPFEVFDTPVVVCSTDEVKRFFEVPDND